MRASDAWSRRVAIVVGADDVGSAVAVLLHRAGFAIVVCDDIDPPWARRGMAFTDAWYLGNAELDGEAAVFCSSVKSIPAVLHSERLIAATTWSWAGVAAALPPVAIIDARTRKRFDCEGPKPRAAAGALTIGIGPGFVAGSGVDLAVESVSGERLGAVVTDGPTSPDAGDIPLLGGAGRERFVCAPHPGRFATSRRIGDRVREGEQVAAVGNSFIAAPIAGVLRGISARGARVAEGTMIVEVDPRGDSVLCHGLEERALAIACGVLSAVATHAVGAAMVPERGAVTPTAMA